MTEQVIPAEAVEAAAKYLSEFLSDYPSDYSQEAREILEAAAPILLSHEREQTRLAHVDAMVNRETKRDELAAEYRRGYRDGLTDRKQVTAEPREWEPGDPIE